MNDRYAGDGTVHPSVHLLKLTELCELFKISGLTRGEVMRKLFALSLKGKALEWYRLLDDSHLLDWEEIQSLFYSKFYPLHEVHENRNYVGRIQRNTEDWEIDKGKESGIIYEYDCIKSFVETVSFNKFSAKFGLDPQLLVDFLKSFASHLNMPKENWIKH